MTERAKSKRNGEFLTQRPSIFASRLFFSLRPEEEHTARAFTALVSSGFSRKADSLDQQRENSRFSGADSLLRVCLRCFAGVEKGRSFKERVRLPEPGSTQPAHLDGKNRLENNIETSGRASVSDLQPASRLLHSSQRSCTGCCRAARDAPHQPENQASLPVGNGGPKRGRYSEQSAVRKASNVTFS
jgi:hypothetical protein